MAAGILGGIRETIQSFRESRGRDPFANRSKGLWQIVGDLDSTFDQKTVDGFDVGPVHTACRIFGQSMASLDFKMVRRSKDREEEQKNHFLTKLFMDKVNNYMNPAVWFVTSAFHWGITGNSWDFIARDKRGRAAELWKIDPHEFRSVELKDNNKKVWTFGSDSKEFKDEDIFHISGPSWDGLIGNNPIEAHRDTVMTSAAINRFIRSFFENGAHVKHVIEVDGVVEDDEYNRFQTSWRDTFSGPNNVGKTPFLENGWTLKPVSLSPVDVAYLAIDGNITKKVANIYGLPLYLFNEFKEGAQYDNVEAQDSALIKYALVPHVTLWEQEIKRKLAGTGNLYGKFDLFSLSRGDMKSISDWSTKYFTIGALNQDEVRGKFLGMNPLPDGLGERYYVQGNNMVPIDKIDQIYDDRLQGQVPGQGGRPTKEQLDTDLPTIKEDL